MATNPANQTTVNDDKAVNTTSTTLDEEAPPAGWMRLKNMGRNKKGGVRRLKDDAKHLSEVVTSSSAHGSGDYSAFQENGARDGLLYTDNPNEERGPEQLEPNTSIPTGAQGDGVVYKVYKRRWFGLIQLVLLNIIVSWDVSTVSFSTMLTKGADDGGSTVVNQNGVKD